MGKGRGHHREGVRGRSVIFLSTEYVAQVVEHRAAGRAEADRHLEELDRLPHSARLFQPFFEFRAVHRLLLSSLLDQSPEFVIGPEVDFFLIYPLDADDQGHRHAVSRDDHTLTLGVVNADLKVRMFDRDRLDRISSVDTCGGFRRMARTTTRPIASSTS